MHETFISIKVCKSNRKPRKASKHALKVLESFLKNKIVPIRNRSIDPTPYDKVLRKISPNRSQEVSRFEAFLKFEMDEKEVVE